MLRPSGFVAAVEEKTGKTVGVIITDSANRPWRLGTIGIAIGAAGLTVLDDYRGGSDMFDRELKVTADQPGGRHCERRHPGDG